MQDQRLEWLKPKMDSLFESKAKQEAKGKDFNTSIQSGREYRNPRIDYWKKNHPESYYDSSKYRRLVEKRERERSGGRGNGAGQS